MNDDQSKHLIQQFPNRIFNPFLFTNYAEMHKGSYGICGMADFQPPYDRVILRRFSRDPLTNNQFESYIKEIDFLINIDHPFAVKTIGATDQPPFCFISQYSNGINLFDIIHTNRYNRSLTANDKTKIVLGISSCMNYLHSRNVINYDLHPQNIILPENGFPFLANFGLKPFSKYFPYSTFHTAPNQWTPPELFNGDMATDKSDVYSFGIILWEMYTGHYPLPNIKPENLVEQVKVHHERPIITLETPKSMRQLMELCWDRDPEKRPSFSQIYQLFITRKVEFEGTDQSVIDEVSNILNEWQAKHRKSITGFNDVQNIPKFFQSAQRIEIFEYSQSMNETNCHIFFKGIYDLVRDTAPMRIKELGLFLILKLIVKNDNCLRIYVNSHAERQLPLLSPELSNVCLSILIPIFAKCPESFIPEYFELFDKLVYKQPLKILRLINTISNTKSFNNQIYQHLIDFLIKHSQFIIKQNYVYPLVNSLYKLFSMDKQLLAARINPIIRILSSCLLSTLNNTLVVTYTVLTILRPLIIPVDPDILIGHIQDHAISQSALQLLCFTRPIRVTIKLIDTLLNETKRTKKAEYALYLLAKYPDAQSILINHQSHFMQSSKVSPEIGLKIVLTLLQDPSYDINIFINKSNNGISAKNKFLAYRMSGQWLMRNLHDFPMLLTNALNQSDSSLLVAICNIFRKYPLSDAFINALEDSGFITKLISIARENPRLKITVYYLVDLLGRKQFVKSFLDLFPMALNDLKNANSMQKYAIAYFSLMSQSKYGIEEMNKYGVSQILSNINLQHSQ